jgi:hypothetical protein
MMIETPANPKTTPVIKYTEISYGGLSYILKEPELFTIHQESSGTLLENERLDIYASGKTMREASEDLSYQFAHSYRQFVNIDDSRLSERLLSVKKYYQFLVKTVRRI